MRPRVFQARPNGGPPEWVCFFQGTTQWFPTWKDAYDYAYTVSRIRNVLADVFAGTGEVMITETNHTNGSQP